MEGDRQFIKHDVQCDYETFVHLHLVRKSENEYPSSGWEQKSKRTFCCYTNTENNFYIKKAQKLSYDHNFKERTQIFFHGVSHRTGTITRLQSI